MTADRVRQSLLLLSALVLPLGGALAQAQEPAAAHPYLKASHLFEAGWTRQKVDAKVRSTVEPLGGTTLDLDDLGVDKRDDSWILGYRYRFNPRWSVLAGAYLFSGSGSIEGQTDFTYDGQQFTAGASLHTKLDVDTYIVDVLYAVYRSERSELNIGGGVHAMDMTVDIRATAFVSDVGDREVSSGGDTLLAPLPNLRVQGFHAFSDRFAVSGTLGWFSANVDEYDGSFSFVRANAQYWFTDRFAAVLGYQYTEVDITRDTGRRETEFDLTFDGPIFELSYAF